jgi:hypothetical protein
MSHAPYQSSVERLAVVLGKLQELSDVASRAVGDADYWACIVGPELADWQRAKVLADRAYRVADGLRNTVAELEDAARYVRRDRLELLLQRSGATLNQD